jgi:hypothetical protein
LAKFDVVFEDIFWLSVVDEVSIVVEFLGWPIFEHILF